MVKNKNYYIDKIFLGIVEENIDINRLGRIKVRVQSVFNEIPLEDIPWASPFRGLDGREFSVPAVGKIVNVIFPDGNIYEPQFIYSENYNINLKNKLKGLDDDEYKNYVSLLFDHRCQISVDDTALNLDYFNNVIRIKDSDIDIKLKDNTQLLKLGHSDCDQDAVLGSNFFEWMDSFMETLLSPATLVGNFGAPILRPALDQKIIEYNTKRTTFVSNNVKIVDNGKIQSDDYDDERENIAVKDDGTEFNDVAILGEAAVVLSPQEEENKKALQSKINDERRRDATDSVENEADDNAVGPREADDYDEGLIEEEDKVKEEKIEKKLNDDPYGKNKKSKGKSRPGKTKTRTGYGSYTTGDGSGGGGGSVSTSNTQSQTVEGSTNTGGVILLGDLAKWKYSTLLTKQSLGGGRTQIIKTFSANSKTITKDDIVGNMNNFIEDVLGPFSTWLSANYPKMIVKVNSATRAYVPSGGSTSSQHFYGQAIDIGVYLTGYKKKTEGNLALFNAMLEWYQLNPVGYDQVLWETRKSKGHSWIHWSYKRNNNRLEVRRFSYDRTDWDAPLTKSGLKRKYLVPPIDPASAHLDV